MRRQEKRWVHWSVKLHLTSTLSRLSCVNFFSCSDSFAPEFLISIQPSKELHTALNSVQAVKKWEIRFSHTHLELRLESNKHNKHNPISIQSCPKPQARTFVDNTTNRRHWCLADCWDCLGVRRRLLFRLLISSRHTQQQHKGCGMSESSAAEKSIWNWNFRCFKGGKMKRSGKSHSFSAWQIISKKRARVRKTSSLMSRGPLLWLRFRFSALLFLVLFIFRIPTSRHSSFLISNSSWGTKYSRKK